MTGLSGNMIIITVLYYGGNLVTSDAITVGKLAFLTIWKGYTLRPQNTQCEFRNILERQWEKWNIWKIAENH